MDKDTTIEYITTVEYAVKVVARSSDLSEQELRQIVKKAVEADLVRDSAAINGMCGGTIDGNKGYSYRYEAISPVKDK